MHTPQGEVPPPSLAGLEAALDAANREMEDAREAASIASHAETDARNKLNAAQKALDKAIEELRKSAPRESDWGTRDRRGEVVGG